MRNRRRLFFAFLSVAALTLAVAVVIKPARVIVPELMGLVCVTDQVCVEDPATARHAVALYQDALAETTHLLGPFKDLPRALFCSTEHCFSRFGDARLAGQNVGTSGMVFNARGWEPHIVKHEMIHHWQNETYGTWAASRSMPRWFVEGMAYTLSADPRDTIPNEQATGWRKEFQDWVAAGNSWRSPQV